METNGQDLATSSGDQDQRTGWNQLDTRGKHWIQAELKRLEQESLFLQKELEELENAEKVSLLLQELLYEIEQNPDPLLPITNGPSSLNWDRWFEGPQRTRKCKCWII